MKPVSGQLRISFMMLASRQKHKAETIVGIRCEATASKVIGCLICAIVNYKMYELAISL
jgi:hypothetical protein